MSIFESKDSGHAVRKDGFRSFVVSVGMTASGAEADRQLLTKFG
jgi:hypothetical protein